MKITKDQYEALPDSLKTFFTVSGDGYEGDIFSQADLDKTTSGLKSKNDELLGKLKTVSDKVAELEAANHDLTVQATKGNGSTEALENSYKAKLQKQETESSAKIQALNNEINDLTSGAAAKSLASKLFGPKADLLLHHVSKRITTEVGSDGKRTLRILDADGNATSNTIDDLTKEFSESESFKGELVKAPSSTGIPPINPSFSPSGGGQQVAKQGTTDAMLARARQITESVSG